LAKFLKVGFDCGSPFVNQRPDDAVDLRTHRNQAVEPRTARQVKEKGLGPIVPAVPERNLGEARFRPNRFQEFPPGNSARFFEIAAFSPDVGRSGKEWILELRGKVSDEALVFDGVGTA
jgi:hypothetical protein